MRSGIGPGIGPEQSSGIPLFHAFTVCDTMSAFHEKVKKICMADMGCL